MLSFKRAIEEDASELTKVQMRAFQVDVELCGSGPPGFDSVQWQIEKMAQTQYYVISSIAEGGEAPAKIVGGFYLQAVSHGDTPQGTYELIRLFVDPIEQGKGIGWQALRFIEGLLPDLKCLVLEASDFRTDNHRFYEKNGFVKNGEVLYGEQARAYQYEKFYL